MAHPKLKQITLYRDLMEEIKIRFDCLNHASNGRTGLPTPIVREFMYQQLRFLCEVIALGCLVAHGDLAVVQSHKMGKTYSADEILKKMSELRPHFYPYAIKHTIINSGAPGTPKHFSIEERPNPLPKEELMAIYVRSHKHLHRGNLKRLLAAKGTPLDLTLNAPEIIAQAQKMSDLLSHHAIAINECEVIMCMLKNADSGGLAQVAIAERPKQTSPATSPDAFGAKWLR